MEQRSTLSHARALERGVAILRAIGYAAEPVGLGSLRAATGIPKSSLVRLLGVLEDSGYVVRVGEEARYRIGPELFRLANAAKGFLDVESLARPHLKQLASASGQTSNLGVLEGKSVLHVCVEEPNRPLRFRSTSGSSDHAYCTGLGKVLLAGLPENDVPRHCPAEPFARFTEQTIDSLAELQRRLEQIHRQGYALDDEERDMGVRCLAIRLELPDGGLAAISLAAPAGELGPEHRERYLEELRATAAALEADYRFCAALTAFIADGRSPTAAFEQ